MMISSVSMRLPPNTHSPPQQGDRPQRGDSTMMAASLDSGKQASVDHFACHEHCAGGRQVLPVPRNQGRRITWSMGEAAVLVAEHFKHGKIADPDLGRERSQAPFDRARGRIKIAG